MSFASEVKMELCREPVGKKFCALAEAYGVLLYCAAFSGKEIRVTTGNALFADRLPRLFCKAFGFGISPLPEISRGGKQSFVIDDGKKIASVFAAYGYDAEGVVQHHINLAVLEDACCKASFIRGAFLAGGSITDPAKGYHMELVTGYSSVSRETVSILQELGFSPKYISRNGSYIAYFKQSEAIEDLFTLIGAPLSAMEIMSAKVEKDMRNAVNRRVNCDSANADKIVSAAQQQLEAIRRLDREFGIYQLPEKLQETALMRIANPEASLADMAALSDPPVSKSCLSHRLKKIIEMAEKLPE